MWNLSRALPYYIEQWMAGSVVYYIASTWPIEENAHEMYRKTPARHHLTEIIKRPLRKYVKLLLQKDGYPYPLEFRYAKCVSNYLRDSLVDAGKLPISSGVLYNGIDPIPFLLIPAESEKEHDILRVLYFGSLTPKKESIQQFKQWIY